MDALTRAFPNLASRLQDSPALSRLGDPCGIRPPPPPHRTRHPYSLAGIPTPRTACAARAPSKRTRHPWRDSSCLSGFCAFPPLAGNTLEPLNRAQGIPQYVRTWDIPCRDPPTLCLFRFAEIAPLTTLCGCAKHGAALLLSPCPGNSPALSRLGYSPVTATTALRSQNSQTAHPRALTGS